VWQLCELLYTFYLRTNDRPVAHPNDSVCVYDQLDALVEVVRAVDGRCEVYMDGGVRTGTDVFKAVALGAKAVFVGRPAVYGLAFAVRLCSTAASLTSRCSACLVKELFGWLGSRVVSVLDSGAVGPGFTSQPRRCRVAVLGKLFTPIVPLFTKQQNWWEPP